MILPPVVRVFFAVAFSADITQKLDQYINGLKLVSRSNKIRWARPENLHITLQFLAEVKSTDLMILLTEVEQQLQAVKFPLRFQLRSLHLFPDPHRPRVLVADVTPQSALAECAALVGKGISQAGYEIDKRAYRAHLSLGRIKTVQTTALSFLQNVEPLRLPEIVAPEIVLFRSVPHPEGSRYIPLARLTPTVESYIDHNNSLPGVQSL